MVGTAEKALSVSGHGRRHGAGRDGDYAPDELNERRREMAILRSVGARPTTILGLLATEAGLLTLAGVALGVALLYAALALGRGHGSILRH